MKYKKMLPGLVLICLMGLAVNCSQKSTSGASNSSLSSAALYQPPQAYCTVNNVSVNPPVPVLKVTNLVGAQSYSSTPVGPVNLQFNCSASTASSGTAVISYVSTNGGSTYTPMVNNVSLPMSFSFGSNSLAIKVIDGLGLTTVVKFNVPVACNPSNYTPVSFNSAGLSISAGSNGPGYFNVTVPAASGGIGPFQYALDLNGDGRFDDYQQVAWNASPSWTNMYNLYSGSRNVGIRVFDVGCQSETTYTTLYNWSSGGLSGAQSGGTASNSTPYYYLQGNVTSLSGSTDPAETVTPFDARELATTPTPLHILCSYNNGQFNITGTNTYSDGVQADQSQLQHDMVLSWNIPDNGSQLSLLNQTATVNNMTYQTAASSDGNYVQWAYQMGQPCTATVNVTRATAVGTCASGETGSIAPETTIWGVYSCPKLTSNNQPSTVAARNISITQGYFYCQQAPVDSCVGSGQSGGSPPTPF